MTAQFTLEYWPDGEWLVGRLREIPGVFSQGKTLSELEDNVRDAYEMMRSETVAPAPSRTQSIAIGLEV